MQTIKFIVFKLNEQSFGVKVEQVISIERFQPITKVPGTEDFIKGIMTLRGEITPVLDLKERLSMRQDDTSEASRILIINIDGIQVGLIVDEATEVIDIDSSIVESPSEIIRGFNQEYIKGIAKVDGGLLILLNLEKIANSSEKLHIKKVIKE